MTAARFLISPARSHRRGIATGASPAATAAPPEPDTRPSISAALTISRALWSPRRARYSGSRVQHQAA